MRKKKGGVLHQLCIVLYVHKIRKGNVFTMYVLRTYLDLHISISSHNKKICFLLSYEWVVMNGYRVND